MDFEECKTLAEELLENHTLWGLHMMGNECILDSCGYIRPGRKLNNATRDILLSPLRETGG
jgi:hypothetical protein